MKRRQKAFHNWRVRTFGDDLTKSTYYNVVNLAETFSRGLPERIPLSGCYMLATKGNRRYAADCVKDLSAIKGPITVGDVENFLSLAKGKDGRKLVPLSVSHHIKIDDDTYDKLDELREYFDFPNNSLAGIQCIIEMYDYYLGEEQKKA